MPEPAEVRLTCPAKVNLSLRVHGARRDGFHEISTVLQTIDLCDRLRVRRVDPEAPLRIEVPGGGAPSDDSNLVVAAARAFFAALGEPARGVRFELEKRIPAGSGLGGGSSDAAAALAGLQRLWGAPLDAACLRAVGAAVGSDVPFFLLGGTGLATGRGERVEALDDISPAAILVAVPGVEVSTAEVYRRWSRTAAAGDAAEETGTGLLPPASRRRDAAAWMRGNDLEPVACEVEPAVNRLLLALRSAWGTRGAGGPQVSGSGGAVFSAGEPPDVESALAGMDARVFRTRTMPRSVRPLFM
jgi:4-diphosphocytidyl-2-C-methyl-D-erythritol kinase